VRADGTYKLDFDDGDSESGVRRENIRDYDSASPPADAVPPGGLRYKKIARLELAHMDTPIRGSRLFKRGGGGMHGRGGRAEAAQHDEVAALKRCGDVAHVAGISLRLSALPLACFSLCCVLLFPQVAAMRS
jgi:hypothetical protein